MVEISKSQARQFWLRHQKLLPPQQLVGPNAVAEIFNYLRLIQYDPLNPCGRNIDLVLQARIADYHPDDYRDWAYEQRQAIEGFDKVLCLLPKEDVAFLQFGRAKLSVERQSFMNEYRADLDKVIAYIRDNGPVATDGIMDERKVDKIGWRDGNAWGKVALETLWMRGELVATRNTLQRKKYDLPERVYGDLPVVKPTAEQHILRRLQATGLLPASGGGTGWLGMALGRELGSTIKRMIASGQLVEVQVEGVKARYVIPAERADQLLLTTPRFESRMTFIAPLDNLVWDRQMLRDLFNFDYTWEVYVPLAKRNFGYYVLPLLYGDQLVGRIEPVFSKSKQLDIKGLWWETKPTKAQLQALDQAIERFKTYLNAV